MAQVETEVAQVEQVETEVGLTVVSGVLVSGSDQIQTVREHLGTMLELPSRRIPMLGAQRILRTELPLQITRKSDRLVGSLHSLISQDCQS